LVVIDNFLEVIYAPQRAFKKIVANPKYLGVIIVLLLFTGIMIGADYLQFSKTYSEQTSPTVFQLDSYTNATSGNWQASSGVSLSNNFGDFYNYSIYVAGYGYYPYVFGNRSLQISADNTQNVSAQIANAFNLNCNSTGFQNLTMATKVVDSQSVPQTATLILYSLTDTNYYQYDLTPSLQNANDIAVWNNLTIPIGPNAQGWTSNGSPSWSNITSLKLDLSYSTASNITIRIGTLYFGGQYISYPQYDALGLVISLLQAFSLQFLISWFLITGLIYLLLRALKTTTTWKPLFIGVGLALVVLVIRALINMVATLALPAIYYPFDFSVGIGFTPYGAVAFPSQAISALSTQSLAIFNNIESMTATFRAILLGMFVVGYVWLGALCTIIIKELQPESSLPKRILLSAVAIGVTILLLILLINGIA
jgi:hypothetical protein